MIEVLQTCGKGLLMAFQAGFSLAQGLDRWGCRSRYGLTFSQMGILSKEHRHTFPRKHVDDSFGTSPVLSLEVGVKIDSNTLLRDQR